MDAAELACASLVVDATGDLIEACGCVLETSRGSLRASHIPYSGDLLGLELNAGAGGASPLGGVWRGCNLRTPVGEHGKAPPRTEVPSSRSPHRLTTATTRPGRPFVLRSPFGIRHENRRCDLYLPYHMLACRSCDVRRPDSCHKPKYPSLLPSMLVTTSHSTRVHAGVEPIPSQSPLPRCEAICLECHLSLQRLGESTVAVPAFGATHPLAHVPRAQI